MLGVFPIEPSEPLAEALSASSMPATAVADLDWEEPKDCRALVVELGDEPQRRLRQVARLGSDFGIPVLVVAYPSHLDLVAGAAGITDLIVTPFLPAELAVRLHRMMRGGDDPTIRFKDLVLNPLTYQASLSSRPLDLTFMEYELLRFLVENQGRVWSREQLLSRVWGYDYYGGARTVDVHVRRLRAKLGEERSSWITTVRSVGYRFG